MPFVISKNSDLSPDFHPAMSASPLQRLHAVHRRARNGKQMCDTKFFFHQPVLRFDHVADDKMRECSAVLRFAITRRSRQSISDRIRCDDKIFIRVQRFAGTNQKIDTVMIAGKPRP
jgi:hypothetical protein